MEQRGSEVAEMHDNVCDYLLAAGRDDDPAVVDGSRMHSYLELRRAVSMIAGQLARLNLADGSRVGLLGPNSFFWVASYLAIMKLNLVAVPLSTALTPADAERNIRFSGCLALITDRRHQRRYADAVPEGIPVVTENALRPEAERPCAQSQATEPDTDAVLMFTSGTTSHPKAVRVTHRNLRANTESIVTYLGLRRDDRMLVVLPFFYCFGASLLHTHLRVGGCVVLCNTFAYPESAIEMLDRERCTGLAGVPSTYQLLLRASTFAARPTPTLRHLQQAGGKLPNAQIRELVEAKPHARVFVQYGQTEATSRLSHLPPEHVLERLGSIGRGIPGVELQVVDDTGSPVPAGQVGQVVARGASISPGYFADPAATAVKFPDGTLRTGDLGMVDEDGFIYVVDRSEDFIKSWGYRVSSQEVEAAALEMADLVSAAAVGVPDLDAGEAITLFVTLAPRAKSAPTAITEHLRRRLAKHMVPRRVEVIDAMPLNANGKIAKAELRNLATTPRPAEADLSSGRAAS